LGTALAGQQDLDRTRGQDRDAGHGRQHEEHTGAHEGQCRTPRSLGRIRVLLVATYELGHQPLSLASPAALLRDRGHEVRALDLSVDPWDEAAASWADRIACSVPMHTATRLARQLIPSVEVPVCCFGLYAGMCADVADHVVPTGDPELLVAWVEGTSPAENLPSTGTVPRPARELLPPLERYVRLAVGDERRLVGTVSSTHGCSHRCRHCPVPVVYNGRTRRLDMQPILDDVEQLVELGAEHITFGDPDFLNAPPHARRVVAATHQRFPHLTFDCTVKVEHVLRHRALWPEFAAAGCLFVVSAFESVNDDVLRILDKGHSAADAAAATAVLRACGIDVRPSFLPFTPWTTRADLHALLDFVDEHDLAETVDPVQYTIRLLLPAGSLLLERPELAPHLGDWDDEQLSYQWRAADPAMDALQRDLAAAVEVAAAREEPPWATYAAVRALAGAPPVEEPRAGPDRPRLTESWFCCAEPTSVQLDLAGSPTPRH
jgi:Radical SAM superfamily